MMIMINMLAKTTWIELSSSRFHPFYFCTILFSHCEWKSTDWAFKDKRSLVYPVAMISKNGVSV